MTEGTEAELAVALARVAEAPTLIVAMDFDGTLSPIVDQPDAARPEPAARDALLRIAALPATDVVVVSGRALADLERRFGGDEGAVDFIGSHGAEDSSTVGSPEDAAAIARVVEVAGEVAQTYPGVVLEPKPFSLAVHYRAVAPEKRSDVLQTVKARLAPISRKSTHGKMVVEFFTRSADKGEALQWYRERRYPDARPPLLFAGDDVTDEAAFQVMTDGDVSVKVGSGPTAATYRVSEQDRVAPMLRTLLELRAAALGRHR